MENKKINILLILLIFFELVNGQGTWIQKANFPGGARYDATSFTINGKGYVCCGTGISFILYSDLWEYDPVTDTWTQKANFPGAARYSPISFVINNKGYVGTGSELGLDLSDLWEYDPQSDSWTQKASLPGAARRRAISFSVLDTGYVYGGYNTNALNDLWAYNPITDSWTQKNNGPGQPRCWGFSFVLNDTAYVGAGEDNALFNLHDVWKYNSTVDQWIQVAQYPCHSTVGVASFAINNYGYSGIVFPSGSSYITNDSLWRYSPQGNNWVRSSLFPAASRYCSVSFSIGNKGYVGLGRFYTNPGPSNSVFNDLWEYTPDSTTAVDDFNYQEAALNIFPNPFNESIEFVTEKNEPIEVILYDITSRKILQKSFS